MCFSRNWLYLSKALPRLGQCADILAHYKTTISASKSSTVLAMKNFLKQQVLEMREVIFTIEENIGQMRSDLEICLPELKNVLISLLLEDWSDIKQFAGELGAGHPLVSL